MLINVENFLYPIVCTLSCTEDEARRGMVRLTPRSKQVLSNCAIHVYEELANYTEEISPNMWQIYHHWYVNGKHAIVHNDKLIW